MFSIILFAIIGAHINAGVGYWIVYGALCLWKVVYTIIKLCN